MGRKIRTGALLILVLAMIYTQQAVIYAQNEAEKNMKKTTESGNSEMSYTIGGTWKCRLYKVATGKF